MKIELKNGLKFIYGDVMTEHVVFMIGNEYNLANSFKNNLLNLNLLSCISDI